MGMSATSTRTTGLPNAPLPSNVGARGDSPMGNLFSDYMKENDKSHAALADSLIDQQVGQIGDERRRSSEMFDQARGLFPGLAKYYKPLVEGDRNAMLEAMAPEVASVTDQYDSAFQSINKLNPRGGGKISAFADWKQKEIGDVTKTLASGRADAVKGQQALFSNLMSVASGSDNAASGNLGNLINTLLNRDQNNAARSDANDAALGQTIGTWAMIAMMAL